MIRRWRGLRAWRSMKSCLGICSFRTSAGVSDDDGDRPRYKLVSPSSSFISWPLTGAKRFVATELHSPYDAKFASAGTDQCQARTRTRMERWNDVGAKMLWPISLIYLDICDASTPSVRGIYAWTCRALMEITRLTTWGMDAMLVKNRNEREFMCSRNVHLYIKWTFLWHWLIGDSP